MSSTKEVKIIAVMGPSGTGKTRFINQVCRTAFPEGGASVEECTTAVQTATFDLDDQRVLLIDTPGFEGDASIRKITAYLKRPENRKLTGIIYMHRITDRRMSGHAVRDFAGFRRLCGDDAMSNVVIVTNMWERIRAEGVGEERETELRTKEYGYKAATEKGAKLLRHHDTAESAMAILRQMLNNNPVSLQFKTSSNGQEDALTPALQPPSTSIWKRFKEMCRMAFWRLYQWCMVPLRSFMILNGIQRGGRLFLDS